MKLNATIADLLELDRQMQNFPFALRCLLNSRIQDWQKENGIRLTSAKDKIAAMHEEYFELDENKNPKSREKLVLTKEELDLPPEQRPREMVMKDGKTMEEYLEKQKKLLETPIEIIF